MAGRREILLAWAAVLAAQVARAQAPARNVHLAVLSDSADGIAAARWRSFFDRLQELGYERGRNLHVTERYSGGVRERLPELAAELVALRPDLMVCATTPATLAAKRATTAIPIVFIGAAEPVETGLVASLSHPGGNVTGTAITSAEMAGKWLEILSEIRPGAKRFGFLGQDNPAIAVVLRAMQLAAAERGASARLLEATTAAHVDDAFAIMSAERYDAFMVASAPVILPQARQISALAIQYRLPGLYARDEYLEAGGLVSYTPDRNAYFRRAAEYVRRILEGARPADLPVERPTKFQLVLNMKAARALGLKLSATFMLRVDRVIE